MPGRACLHKLGGGGEASADNTTNTARGSWGWSLLQVDRCTRRFREGGEGPAEGSVHRTLRREEQEAVNSMESAWWSTRPDGGGAARSEDQSRLPFATHSSG